MSDGGGESGREYEHNAKTKSSSESFARALTKVAVAQVCESAGFQGFQQSALETLSDIVTRYITDIGKSAQFYANLAGRSDCNSFDIVQGLEDLGSSQGFSGASDINHCLADSGVVRELSQYVGVAEEIPFAHNVPQFPVVKEQKPASSFLQRGEEPAGEHIPVWLPAFPEPITFSGSPERNEKVEDKYEARIEEARQRRKGERERSMLNMQQHLACNGSEPLLSVDPVEAAKAKQAAESNPFLASPFQFGEKSVSVVVFPVKLSNETVVGKRVLTSEVVDNHVSVADAFAPAMEGVENRLCDSEGGLQKVPLNKRPNVRFKFRSGKQPLRAPLDMGSETKGVEKTGSWFSKDDEKDEKKRRAEKILKESVENQQELAEL